MLITIIIPVYNAEHYLGACLDSLRAQTFEDWEAICVDDGSTDGCPGILDEYVRRDSRIIVVHKKNGGPSSARNTAMPMAHGEWIGFLDSDDVLESDWLQNVAVKISEGRVDLVRCGFKWWFFEDNEGRVVGRGKNYEGKLTDPDAVMRWGWTSWPREGMACLCFYRRKMLLASRVLFEVGCVLEDMIFNMTLLPHIESMSQITSDGYLYRQRAGSFLHGSKRTFANTEQILFAGLRIYEDQRRRLVELDLIPVAFKQMFIIVWGNIGALMFKRSRGEEKTCADVRRLAYRVLEPCVKDRFSNCSAPIQKAITVVLSVLCGCKLAHFIYRLGFRFAWNVRDFARRLKKAILS